LFRYGLSPETFGYTLVLVEIPAKPRIFMEISIWAQEDKGRVHNTFSEISIYKIILNKCMKYDSISGHSKGLHARKH